MGIAPYEYLRDVPPGNAPYSWYENGEARGIAADLFRAVAQELQVPYEIAPGAGLTLQMGINNESGICQAHLRGLYPGRGQPDFQDSGNGPGHVCGQGLYGAPGRKGSSFPGGL